MTIVFSELIPKFISWVRQPTNLTSIAIAVGATVYWFTNSAEAAGLVASIILGGVDDSTKGLLAKVQRVEDIAKGNAAGIVSNLAQLTEINKQ